jgi:xanthosine phosphorylase
MSDRMTEVMEVIHRYAPPGFSPKIGLILGSGLSALAEDMTHSVSIPYQAIPGMHSSTVAGHTSMLVMGYLNQVPILCFRGRLHLYEGHAYESMQILVRIIKQMGAQVLLITASVGSMFEEAQAGDLMLINDHINFQFGNPLVGMNDESMGPRFVNLAEAYDSDLQELMLAAAAKLGFKLFQGVYLATLGPSFETPAEIRAFKQWGADAVGMSVVPEVILARHCGLRVACIAAITNKAAGLSAEHLSHESTLHVGEIATRKLVKLIPQFLKAAADELK